MLTNFRSIVVSYFHLIIIYVTVFSILLDLW